MTNVSRAPTSSAFADKAPCRSAGIAARTDRRSADRAAAADRSRCADARVSAAKPARANEGAPSPSGEVCAATGRARSQERQCGDDHDRAHSLSDIADLTARPIPLLAVRRVHYNYGRSYIRSAGLAARQGALARRARGLGRRGVSRPCRRAFASCAPTSSSRSTISRPRKCSTEMQAETEFDLLGLFQGVGLPFRSESAAVQMPNMIWLYRRPILDYWAEHDETLGRHRPARAGARDRPSFRPVGRRHGSARTSSR